MNVVMVRDAIDGAFNIYQVYSTRLNLNILPKFYFWLSRDPLYRGNIFSIG